MKVADKKLYELKAEIIAAAGHPVRLAVIDFLRDGPQCVCDIAAHLGEKRSNVSRHLAVMLKAGLLTVHKEGLRQIYSLKTPCILNFIECITAVLREQMTETREVLRKL